MKNNKDRPNINMSSEGDISIGGDIVGRDKIVYHYEKTDESFAQCPKCSRNDKVKKITEIKSDKRFTSPAKPDFPYFGIEPIPPASPQQPAVPPKLGRTIRDLLIWAILIISLTITIIFLVRIVWGIVTGQIEIVATLNDSPWYKLSVALVAGGLAFLALSLPFLCTAMICSGLLLFFINNDTRKDLLAQQAFSIKLKRYQEQLTQHQVSQAKYVQNKERELLNYSQKIEAWENAMKRWELLYFCERDGSIFIPGEKWESPENLTSYLFRRSSRIRS